MKIKLKPNIGNKLLFILIALFLFPQLFANNGETYTKPAKSIEYYIEVADSLSKKEQFNAAIENLKKALQLTSDSKNINHKALLFNKIGRCESFSGNENKAIEYFKLAKEYAVLSNDSVILGDSFNNLGISYEYTGKHDSAFYYYEKALQIREQFYDTSRLSASYRNIAQVLRVLRRLKEATQYCRRAYALIPGIGEYSVIANIYNELAYLYELNNQLDSAEYFYIQLIEISQKNEFQRGISVGYSNLASVYEREKKYNAALSLKKKGLQIDKGINDIYGMMNSYRSIAECYLLMKDYSNTLIYIDSATNICDSSWIADLHGIEMLRYEAHSGQGNFKLALIHYEKAIELKDSLFNERKRKNIAEVLTKYETEKKEQQILILDKTNQLKSERIRIQWIILSAIILFSISGAFISLLIIKNKNHRINQMSLELRNYMLQHDDFKNLKREQIEEEKGNPLKILTQKFGLTQREGEILILISKGLTNDELGEKLFISRNTIKYHIKNIYIKLDVRNRVQALQKAALNNLSTLS